MHEDRAGDETRAVVSAIPEQLIAHFAILRRAQVKGDALHLVGQPPFVSGRIRRTGLNPTLARRVVTELGEMWVIPGDGFVALYDGSMVATEIDFVVRNGTVMWTSTTDGANLVCGLVPDGASEIALTATNGATVTVPVLDNVYRATLDGPFEMARFRGAAGDVAIGPGAE